MTDIRLEKIDFIVNSPGSPGSFKSLDMNNNNLRNVADPINPGDAVNKKTLENELSKNINQFLPVSDYTAAFIPNYNSCEINKNGECHQLKDVKNNLALNSESTKKPLLKLDNNTKNSFLYFDGVDDCLCSENTVLCNLFSKNGEDGSFVFILKPYQIKREINFYWKNNFSDKNNLYRISLPNNDGLFDIKFGNSDDILSGPSIIDMHSINRIIFVKNKSSSTFYKCKQNGDIINFKIKSTGFFENMLGKIILGGDEQNLLYSKMDFYGLIFYDRALTAEEVYKYNLYLIGNY